MMRLLAALATGVAIGIAIHPWTGDAHHSIPHNYQQTSYVVHHVFGRYGTAHRAMQVTRCETGGIYNAGARNRSSGTTGIFQMHPGWIGKRIYWGRRSILVRNNLYGRWPNALYALYLSKGGRDWSHWAPVCRA